MVTRWNMKGREYSRPPYKKVKLMKDLALFVLVLEVVVIILKAIKDDIL